jgi:hypothetical protein
MDTLITIWGFVKVVLLNSFTQLIALLGIFFFFGLLLYFLARFTRVTFVKSIGYKFDVYITGWLGTPVHELGHALLCIPFGHRITEMRLYSPNSDDGSLGYVNHSYNPNNFWHQIGNFFIGIGPILMGSAVLFLLIKYLVPHNQNLMDIVMAKGSTITSLADIKQQLVQLYHTGLAVPAALFTKANMQTWQFWVFLYVAMAVASHMELSLPDLKGAWSGLISIAILLLVINSITLFFKVDITASVAGISRYATLTSGIFTMAVVLSAMFFVVSFLLLNVYTLIRYRKLFHPIA